MTTAMTAPRTSGTPRPRPRPRLRLRGRDGVVAAMTMAVAVLVLVVVDVEEVEDGHRHGRTTSMQDTPHVEAESSRKHKRKRPEGSAKAAQGPRVDSYDHSVGSSRVVNSRPPAPRRTSTHSYDRGEINKNGGHRYFTRSCQSLDTGKGFRKIPPKGPKSQQIAIREQRAATTDSSPPIRQPTCLSGSNSVIVAPHRNFQAEKSYTSNNHGTNLFVDRSSSFSGIEGPDKAKQPTRPKSKRARPRSRSTTFPPDSDAIETSSNDDKANVWTSVMSILDDHFYAVRRKLQRIMKASNTMIMLDAHPILGAGTHHTCRIKGDDIGTSQAKNLIRKEMEQSQAKDRKGKGKAIM